MDRTVSLSGGHSSANLNQQDSELASGSVQDFQKLVKPNNYSINSGFARAEKSEVDVSKTTAPSALVGLQSTSEVSLTQLLAADEAKFQQTQDISSKIVNEFNQRNTFDLNAMQPIGRLSYFKDKFTPKKQRGQLMPLQGENSEQPYYSITGEQKPCPRLDNPAIGRQSTISGGLSEDQTLVEMFPQASRQFSDEMEYLGNSTSDESFRRIEDSEPSGCCHAIKSWTCWLFYPLYFLLYYALCCFAYSRKDSRKASKMKNPLNLMAKQLKMPFKKKKNVDDLVTINAMLELLKNSDFAVERLRQIRINPQLNRLNMAPSLEGEFSKKNSIRPRCDLEFYCPQIISHFLRTDLTPEQEEEIERFIVLACSKNLFFAHKIWFNLQASLMNPMNRGKVNRLGARLRAEVNTGSEKLFLANSERLIRIISKANLWPLLDDHLARTLQFQARKDKKVEKADKSKHSFFGFFSRPATSPKRKGGEVPLATLNQGADLENDFVTFGKSHDLEARLNSPPDESSSLIKKEQEDHQWALQLQDKFDIRFLPYKRAIPSASRNQSIEASSPYFLSSPNLINDLTEVSLRILKHENKLAYLKDQLKKINKNLPATAYLPILGKLQRNFMVLSVAQDESRLFITAEKAPFLICVEVFQPLELELVIHQVQAKHRPRAFEILNHLNLVNKDQVKLIQKLNYQLSKPQFVDYEEPDEEIIRKKTLEQFHSHEDCSPLRANPAEFSSVNPAERNAQFQRDANFNSLEEEKGAYPIDDAQSSYKEHYGFYQDQAQVIKREDLMRPTYNDLDESLQRSTVQSAYEPSSKMSQRHTYDVTSLFRPHNFVSAPGEQIELETQNMGRRVPVGSEDKQNAQGQGQQIVAKPRQSTRQEYQELKVKLFGNSESSEQQDKRLRASSPYGWLKTWRLVRMIVKSGDDLRTEQFAMQLIETIDLIFKKRKLKLRLCPYDILSTGPNCGVVEFIPDAFSIDYIKKKMAEGAGRDMDLADFYQMVFGEQKEKAYKKAVQRFTDSLAAYSLVCYILQIKDRHNANILINQKDGSLIHIDFGFILCSRLLNFETAPFKLTGDMIRLLGGLEGDGFKRFKEGMIDGFQALHEENEKIMILVKMLAESQGDLPCFKKGAAQAINELSQRLTPHGPQIKMDRGACKMEVERIIRDAYRSWSTIVYDRYQYCCQGIF